MISRFPWHLSRRESTFSAGDAGDMDLIPGLGRSAEGGNGNPLQYSCMEKSRGWRGLMGYSPWGCKESGLFHVSTGHLYVLLIQFLCPYFVVGLFCCVFFWGVNVSCIYWIITIYWICGLQIFVSIPKFNFSFLFFWWLLYCGEVFSFDGLLDCFVVVFLFLSCKCFLYILDNNYILDMWFANICFHSKD